MADTDAGEDGLRAAASDYERAEATYLAALAEGAEDQELSRLAKRVAEAAKAYDVADNAAVPTAGTSPYYDAPEVLSTLWSDVAAAYERRTR